MLKNEILELLHAALLTIRLPMLYFRPVPPRPSHSEVQKFDAPNRLSVRNDYDSLGCFSCVRTSSSMREAEQ